MQARSSIVFQQDKVNIPTKVGIALLCHKVTKVFNNPEKLFHLDCKKNFLRVAVAHLFRFYVPNMTHVTLKG